MNTCCIPAATDPHSRNVAAYHLALSIADESARSDVECIALAVPSNHPMPVYDVRALEPGLPQDDDMQDDYRAALDKAVRYLDLRGLLVRPIAGQPQFVSFARAA